MKAIVTIRHKGFCERGMDPDPSGCCSRSFMLDDEDIALSNQATPRDGFEQFTYKEAGFRRALVFTIAETCSIDMEFGE